jgi:hypothetical protein
MTERPPNQTDKNSNTKSTFEQFLKSRGVARLDAFTVKDVKALKALDGILGPCDGSECCDYCEASVHNHETYWIEFTSFVPPKKSCLACIVKAFRKHSKTTDPEEVTTEAVWEYLSKGQTFWEPMDVILQKKRKLQDDPAYKEKKQRLRSQYEVLGKLEVGTPEHGAELDRLDLYSRDLTEFEANTGIPWSLL